MSVELEVSGALKLDVADRKAPLARDMGRQARRIVKDAGGKLTRYDVINGHLFITLKDDKGFEELKKEFAQMSGVTVQVVTPLMLVYLKSTASVMQKAA